MIDFSGFYIKVLNRKVVFWSIITQYGTGTYTLIGNEYEEDILINFNKLYEGKKVKMTLELVNDTLLQTYHPVDSTGKQIETESSIEKYIRIK